MFLRCACLAFVLLGTVFAQDAAHVRHYDLAVAPDFTTKTIRITADIEIDNPVASRGITFRLSEKYNVESLTIDGSPGIFKHNDDELSVSLPGRNSVTLRTVLVGTPGPSDDEPRPCIDDDSLFLLWSDAWYPMAESQWATVRVTLHLPSGFDAIAPGQLATRTERDDNIELVYETVIPTVNFSVFADRHWTRTERDLHGMKFITLLHPESQQYSEKIFAGSSAVLDYFTRLHGYYPFEQFAFVTTKGTYARRAHNGFIAYSPSYLDKEMTRTGYDAHETSLLWWGYAVKGYGPGSYQWFEGLGDYVEVLYSRDTKKPLTWNFIRFRDEYLKSDFKEEPGYAQMTGRTPQRFVHGKYPWLLGALHQQMGDEAFRNAVRNLFSEYRHKAFSLDDFVAVFARENSAKVQRWRKEWLDRPGVPELTVDYSVARHDNQYRVSGTVTQNGSLYTLTLPVGVQHETTLEPLGRIDIRDKVTSFQFDSPEKPSALGLDPEQTYLIRVTYQAH